MTCSGDACLRVGLGPKVLRGRADGDELDIDALIDLFVDLRSGYSPPEHVYLERRKACSQSRRPHPARRLRVRHRYRSGRSRRARPPAAGGRHTGRHTRRAWRPRRGLCVSVPGPTRSPSAGDQDVRATFRRRRASTAQSAPTIGLYATRRRHPWCRRNPQERRPARRIGCWSSCPMVFLMTMATKAVTRKPTPRKALEELRTDGVACLCLSIGAATATDALERVFGSAGHASARPWPT